MENESGTKVVKVEDLKGKSMRWHAPLGTGSLASEFDVCLATIVNGVAYCTVKDEGHSLAPITMPLQMFIDLWRCGILREV